MKYVVTTENHEWLGDVWNYVWKLLLNHQYFYTNMYIEILNIKIKHLPIEK